jgi:hypothetical protein
MRLMRNKRTGRTAAYDEKIIAEGNWEEVIGTPAPKPFNEDAVKAADEISISITRGDGESIEHQA